jgi:hypothetical protein
LLAAAALLAAGSAQAALPPPSLSAPAEGATVDSVPPFAWSSVRGADRYELQVAADAGFNAPVLGRGQDDFFTRNTRATLKKTVPNGRYWWRVRSVGSSGGVSRWSPGRSFRKTWTAAAALQSPSGGGTLVHPADPLRLTWSPVPGAAKYLVSLATDPALGSLVATEPGSSLPVQTAASSFTSPGALAPGVYYWGITPLDAEGNRGAPSAVASFTWSWPSTTATRITDLADASEVYDPQFAWDAVPGATRYELEVNSSQDFAPGSKVCCADPTIATSLAPTGALKDNRYYWRVRALDADGNAGVWNVGPSFTKTFDKVPPVAAPSIKNLHLRDNLADPGTDLQPGTAGYQTKVPILVWDSVPGAASYQVEVTPFASGACDWTAASGHWLVTTAVTAWTPLGTGWNFVKPYPDAAFVATDLPALTPGTSYCARVRARSDRADNGLSDVYGDYTYLDDGTGPAFAWTGYPTGGTCTPPCTSGYLGAGDYVLPAAATTAGRTPLFTWKPLAGKASYFVIVAKDASFSTIVDYAFTRVPAYAPRGPLGPTTYADETTSYYWVVLPATGADGSAAVGNPLSGAPQFFQKQSSPPMLIAPAASTVFLGQPTFRWTLADGARRYRLQVAQDPSFGSPIDDVVTDATSYTSSSTYPADTLLYWRVRADDENLVGLTWSATGTFEKKLTAPARTAGTPTGGDFLPTWSWDPIQGALSYDVSADLPDGTHRDLTGLRMAALTPIKMYGTGVFHWRVRANFPKSTFGTVSGPFSPTYAFARTIGEPGHPHADGSPHHVLLTWDAKLGVRNYRVQVSSRRDFATLVEDVPTDNTSYAPTLTEPAYVDGGLLYWHVAGVDEGDNVGDFTPAQRITLAPRMQLFVAGLPLRGRRSVFKASVSNAAGRPLRRVNVTVSGAGVRRRARMTTSGGTAAFTLRPRRRGALVFRASRPGYQPASFTLQIR